MSGGEFAHRPDCAVVRYANHASPCTCGAADAAIFAESTVCNCSHPIGVHNRRYGCQTIACGCRTFMQRNAGPEEEAPQAAPTPVHDWDRDNVCRRCGQVAYQDTDECIPRSTTDRIMGEWEQMVPHPANMTCERCGKGIEWNDKVQAWIHLDWDTLHKAVPRRPATMMQPAHISFDDDIPRRPAGPVDDGPATVTDDDWMEAWMEYGDWWNDDDAMTMRPRFINDRRGMTPAEFLVAASAAAGAFAVAVAGLAIVIIIGRKR